MTKIHCLSSRLALIATLFLLLFVIPSYGPPDAISSLPMSPPVQGFVVRHGTQLLLNGRSFRFSGVNLHWLLLDDNAQYVSQFRVTDALDAAREMGATVVRSHSLGISTGCSNCLEPSLGHFNDTAFSHMDYVLKAARERGIRFIIPLTDTLLFAQGGKSIFTTWRGLSDEDQFYSDSEVIGDFEHYIKILLTHVNRYTGVAYKDDPTIMAWETGNELNPPTSWTRLISSFIKHIDHNHLVVDGRYGIDPAAASLPEIDIVSDHFYPMDAVRLKIDARAARAAGKVFYAGEFNWNDTSGDSSLADFLSTIEKNPVIAGDTLWELWSHSDTSGYVSNEVLYTLHYPGDSPHMRASVQLLRTHAYTMRGVAAPPVAPPGQPLLHIQHDDQHNVLIWRGTALAASYTIQFAPAASGPWQTICQRCATDLNTPWQDPAQREGPTWYRVIAYNLPGAPGPPSPPVAAVL